MTAWTPGPGRRNRPSACRLAVAGNGPERPRTRGGGDGPRSLRCPGRALRPRGPVRLHGAGDLGIRLHGQRDPVVAIRAEARSVGKECVSKCRSRWSTYTLKKKQKITITDT